MQVVLRKSDSYIACNCKKYVKVGILCSHGFHVLNAIEADNIPDSLITKRWLKDTAYKYEDEDTTTTTIASLATLNTIHREVQECIILADYDSQKLDNNLQQVKKIKEQLTLDSSGEKLSRKQFFESVIRMEAPANIVIKPPEVARTKGCGKRLKSTRELSIEKSKKQKRMCSYCKTIESHDLRNCPKKRSESLSSSVSEITNESLTQDENVEAINLSND